MNKYESTLFQGYSTPDLLYGSALDENVLENEDKFMQRKQN